MRKFSFQLFGATLAFVTFCVPSPSFAFDDSDIQVAIEYSKRYIALANDEFENYSQVDIVADSSPEASIVYRSFGRMERLHCAWGVLERCTWRPSIAFDDRFNKQFDTFASKSDLKTFTVESRQFIVQRGDCIELDAAYKLTHSIAPVRCLDIFDLPLHTKGTFSDRLGTKLAANYVLGGEKICVEAKKDGDRVESIWIRKGGHAISVVSFENKLPVKYECYDFGGPLDLTNPLPDRSLGRCLAIVDTKWGRLGEKDIPYEIHSLLDDTSNSRGSIDITATISVFDRESPEFHRKYVELEAYSRRVTAEP